MNLYNIERYSIQLRATQGRPLRETKSKKRSDGACLRRKGVAGLACFMNQLNFFLNFKGNKNCHKT